MTDSTTPPPPAGWYPAPDGTAASWWWDGAKWTQPQPQHEPVAPPPSSTSVARFATATQVLLILTGVMSAATIITETFGLGAVAAFLAGDESAIDGIDLYDQRSQMVGIASLIAIVGSGVLWALWQYRAARLVRGRTRRSPGWHAGSWFIPIASLWLPYQNISDLWRATGRARPSWQIIWWSTWLAGNAVSQWSARVSLTAGDLEQFRVAMWMSVAGEVLSLVALPFALLTVRGITRGLEQHATSASPSLVG